MKRQRGITQLLLMALVGISIAGCSEPGPPIADVEGTIEASLADYSISDISCKNFASETQSGMGRTSCSGSLALTPDLYQKLDFPQISDQLVSAGIPREGASFFYNRHRTSILAKIADAGTLTDFTAECSYREQVEGWSVDCRPEFAALPGQQLGLFNPPYAIVGSTEHTQFLQNVKADFDDWNTEYLSLKKQVEDFFTKGNVIVAYKKWKTPNPVFRAPINEDFVWQGEPGFLGQSAEFAMQTKYQVLQQEFLQRGANQSFCGHRKGTPPDDLLITGSIYTVNRSANESGPRFAARLQIADRMVGNRFSGCFSFNWTGQNWQYKWVLGQVDLELVSAKP